MRADSASHLVRHPISFELFLLLYLVCALLLQKVNIYKTNYHRVDVHIVVFIVVVLGRRLAWCSLHLIRTRSQSKDRFSLRVPGLRVLFSDYAKGNQSRYTFWTLLTLSWSVNLQRLCVGIMTLPPIFWAIVCLVQNTSVFNMLFLFYPLLLYFSLFGFTLEPRCYRTRFEPPRKFLEHSHWLPPASARRQASFPPLLTASVEILAHHNSAHHYHHYNQHHYQGHASYSSHSSPQQQHSMLAHNGGGGSNAASHQAQLRHRAEKLTNASNHHLNASSNSGNGGGGHHYSYNNRPHSSQPQHQYHHNRQTSSFRGRGSESHFSGSTPSSMASTSPLTSCSSSSSSRKGHVLYSNGRVYSGKESSSEQVRLHQGKADSLPVYATAVGMGWKPQGSPGVLFFPSSPEEVRNEVDILLSDLVVRLKQLLFNSILCAYYVGFIPIQFANGHLYYDRWWCLEHTFLVWANSFVILSSHLLPPSYCQLLYHCSLHLGRWDRCSQTDSAHKWSPDVSWSCNKVVQWNGDFFKAEGPQNVAVPSKTSQYWFYGIFHSRLNVHTWLLSLQVVIVAFQIVVLLRSMFWFQTLSMSVLLAFNSFILYRLLYNTLWLRRHEALT